MTGTRSRSSPRRAPAPERAPRLRAGQNITFLLTDVQDSVHLWEQAPAAMRRAHEEKVGEFRRAQPLSDLEELLKHGVTSIDGWNEAVLDRQSGPYPDWQKYQSREDFYRTRLPKR